jgi:alpha-tubulin suppressor-like RCC1 family protein
MPSRITLPASPTSLALGRSFQCVIAGQTLCWGSNGSGQLGTGDTTAYATPQPVMVSGTAALVALEGGDDHVCALDGASVAHCWGHNDFGTMGTGSNNPTDMLTPGNVLPPVASLPQIAGWHACSLDAGQVYCWGEGDNGELGDGSSTSSPTPQAVPGLADVQAIATGGGPTDHDASCAVRADGSVACWGNGFFGRLGQGSADPSTVPVAVVGLPASATAVSIGYDHTCALLVDGDIWCWGRGDSGQLGDGMMTSSLAPVRVLRPTAGN